MTAEKDVGDIGVFVLRRWKVSIRPSASLGYASSPNPPYANSSTIPLSISIYKRPLTCASKWPSITFFPKQVPVNLGTSSDRGH